MKNWYGCIGFVSLLGVWGALAEEPLFYPFFAFLVFFEYFWVTPDEMFLDTMKKCAPLHNSRKDPSAAVKVDFREKCPFCRSCCWLETAAAEQITDCN